MPKRKPSNNPSLSLQASLSASESFDYALVCSSLLKDPEQQTKGRQMIINALDNWDKFHTSSSEILTDLIETAGFYPYLEKNKTFLQHKNLSGNLRKELHLSKHIAGIYHHEEQKKFYSLLEEKKNLVLSAPTSFGKSLLIEEIIASKIYKNIIVIQPTLALIDETRKKLVKYNDYYKLIVRTSQDPSELKGNVFLFTGERVQEYNKFPKIELLILDEFYKLSKDRDDERWDILNNAVYQVLNKHKPSFYLLGPNIDGISEGFANKYQAEFHKTNFSLVDNRITDLYTNNKELIDKANKPRADKEVVENKENLLFELLLILKDEQNIIYCSSPDRARSLALKFQKYLKSRKTKPTNKNLPLINWIEENISKQWSLIEYLKFQIGIHDGALQKHISSSIINLFNDRTLKYLFCTSTIIEGVNTSAKNIIVFDQKKGPKPIDFFDYSNIKGRAGRMMIHYVGNVYTFIPTPVRKELVVDIPFFEQKLITKEILNNLNDKDIKDKNNPLYKELMQIPEEERTLFRKNGVSIDGQKEILKQLQEDLKTQEGIDLLTWQIPDYNQLKYLLELAWKHLLKKGETTSPVLSASYLTRITFNVYNISGRTVFWLISDLSESNQNYLAFYKENATKIESHLKSLTPEDRKSYRKNADFKRYSKGKSLKDKTEIDIINESITDAFQIHRHWFQYKVPKWIRVINELQKFVFEKKGNKGGNYSYYASLIENDLIQENLAILLEYGIPSTAIKKLEKLIPSSLIQDEVLNEIKRKKYIDKNIFSEYEKIKLRESF